MKDLQNRTLIANARRIVEHFISARQVGHTTAQREGWERHPEALVVAAGFAWGFHAKATNKVLNVFADIGDRLRGYPHPVVIDHDAVRHLLAALLCAIDEERAECARLIVDRDNARGLAGELGARIGHRDRALKHLAEVIVLLNPCYSVDELIDHAMRSTAPGRPAERPLRITTTADVAPLLKAIDELSCALRGVARPETRANGGEA